MKSAAAGVALVGLLSLLTPIAYAANDDLDARVLRAERWLKAAFSHQPGLKDDAVTEVSLWSDAELRALFVDESALAQLMRNPTIGRVRIPAIGGRRQPPPYSSWQIHRLRVLACAASGELRRDECSRMTAEDEIDPTLKRLARAATSGVAGDFILRRGALLHTDIAMFDPAPVMAPDASPADGVPIRVELQDGESNGFNAAPIHWQMARQLLDSVKASPSDTFVRRWYTATAAWMQDREQHDTVHLKHARELFPDDPDILFLSACQQETYASPAIQSVLRSAVLPQGFSLDIAPEATALRDAEEYFRRALARDPGRREARIHLGHVLLARGRAAEAADQLRQVDPASQPPLLRYFHALFLGAAEEALMHFDQAREAYDRAQALFPGAQSPYLALGALATHRGDRATALKETARLFDLPVVTRQPDDPWWLYRVSHTRNVEALFEELYAPFAEAGR